MSPGLLLIPCLACKDSTGGAAIFHPTGAPAIQELAPAQAYPYDEITIRGEGLSDTRRVLIAGHQAKRVQVISDQLIRVEVPLEGGMGPVTVTTGSGTAVSSGPFRILPVPPDPVITAFTPAQGAPGTVVTLDGTGLLPTRTVTFHGIPAVFTVVSDTRLTATVPAGFQEGVLSLGLPARVSATASGTFRATVPAPVLHAFLPVSGPAGTRVFLQGAQLQNVQAVTLGGRPVPVFAVAETTLSFEVPVDALTGPIAVTDGAGATVSTAPAVFTVDSPAPTASGFDPASGPVGAWVTVAGANLGQITGATVGGVAVEVMEPAAPGGATLRLRVPPGALTGPVVLQSAAGAVQVPGGAFTVTSPVLRADSFSPVQGLPGTVITVLGGNLDQVQLVDFGGATAAPASVAPDALTVAVPAGAATGPLRLLTAGGDIQVPGPAFTVLSEAPAITGFDPAGGPPGTEVALAGQHLGTFTELRYGSLVVPPEQVERMPGGLRFRVPDGANQSAVISVTTPGGTAQADPVFQLVPSRLTALNQALVRRDLDFAGWTLDFPRERRAAQYNLGLPQAPVLHPYNPGDNGALRDDHFFPSYPVSLQLPAAFLPALPRALRDQMAALNLDPARVDILVSGQDYPYPGTFGASGAPDQNTTYLFRPHYWTDPEAPYRGVYFQAHQLQAAFFEAESALRVSGRATGVLFPFSISTHGPSATAAGDILSSGFSEPVAGLDVTTTTAFWSLVVMGDRAAATLHLLFSDADLALLQQGAPGFRTLGELLAATPQLGNTRAFRMLRALGRPLLGGTTGEDTPAGRVVHLRGTGLAGTTAVRLGETPLPFTVLSDALALATLPPEASGTLTVTTPLGTSDPVALP